MEATPNVALNANKPRLRVTPRTVVYASELPPLRKNGRAPWKHSEKKLLLSILEEHGDRDVQKIAQLMPTKTKVQIAGFLNKYKRMAVRKFYQKKLIEADQTLNVIHPWISFLNMFYNPDVEVHDHLIAYMLPLIERYGNHPSPEKYGGVDFRLAYRALFNSLVQEKFPDGLNRTTVSMMYAGVSQLLEDVRNSGGESETVLKKCLGRYLTNEVQLPTQKETTEDSTLQLPEVNVLKLTSRELELLCKK